MNEAGKQVRFYKPAKWVRYKFLPVGYAIHLQRCRERGIVNERYYTFIKDRKLDSNQAINRRWKSRKAQRELDLKRVKAKRQEYERSVVAQMTHGSDNGVE